MTTSSLVVVPAHAGTHTPRPIVKGCCSTIFAQPLFSLPPRSGGEGLRVGGCAANAAVSEFADRPPTPDPSPPRADARGGRGEGEFDFQTAFRILAAHFARGLPLNSGPLPSEGAGNAGRPMRPPPRVRWQNAESTQRQSGHTGIVRHSPRNGFNGFLRALPGDRLCCHRHP
jgi:hypothetical protein